MSEHDELLTKVHASAAIVSGLLACFGCAPAAPLSSVQPSGTIRAAAGAALMPLVQSAAHDFDAQHPKLVTAVVEARSSAAISKLIADELDLAFTARPVRSADMLEAQKKARSLHMVVIAAEAVAVVVHPDNPIQDISARDLQSVFFSGAVHDWADLTGGKKRGAIKVVAVNPKTSGTGELFVTTIAGDGKPAYVSGAEMLDYSDDTIAKVAAEPDAISFSGMGNVDKSVHRITIDAVEPTEKTILDTSYVLNRKLFVITNGAPRGGGRDFVKFILSERGQRLARAKGITPIALD